MQPPPPDPRRSPGIAARAEALDRAVLVAYIETQQRDWPAGGAGLRAHGAGLAAFDGTGRDSRLIGLDPADASALDALVAWHARTRAAARFPCPRHAALRVVLPPEADPATAAAALGARGFTRRGKTPVLWRPLAEPVGDPDIAIVEAGPADRLRAIEAIARGYLDGAEPDPLELQAGATWFDLPGAHHFLALRDGAVLGGAALVLRGSDALLGQMSVLPAHRRRGVQRALIAHRLEVARQLGATAVFATAAPGGPSQRNLERAGFVVSHTRVSWVG